MSFGTPPIKYYGIIDTGSDLIWTQCEYPYFDPQKSSTYTSVYCQEDEFNQLGGNFKRYSGQNQCSYAYLYGDKSITEGLLCSTEIIFKLSLSLIFLLPLDGYV
ncbi:hypothetical protein Lal_00032086 [Lupinus albus]|nr:hypothetical protein Lal_00032086 [Lupinus albus]